MAESIYDKYGGFGTIADIVQKFYRRVLASPNLAPYFANTDLERLMDHQTKFLCKVLGGPDNFEGRSLKAAHAHLKITRAAFDEVAGHLVDERSGHHEGRGRRHWDAPRHRQRLISARTARPAS